MGSLSSIVFYHTHIAKEILLKIYYGNGRGTLHLWLNNREIRTKALIDTGNGLTEPITGKSVHLVEYSLLKPYLSGSVRGFIDQFYGKPPEGESMYSEQDFLKTGFRIIPYHSIGTDRGVLLGITADKLTFTGRQKKYKDEGCIIVPYPGKISGEGDCRALVHPGILRK